MRLMPDDELLPHISCGSSNPGGREDAGENEHSK